MKTRIVVALVCLLGLSTSLAPGQAKRKPFGTEWPPLEEVLTFDRWMLPSWMPRNIHIASEGPEDDGDLIDGKYELRQWRFSQAVFTFRNDNTFHVRFDFSVHGILTNRFGITERSVLIDNEPYVRQGSWTLESRPVSPEETKTLVGSRQTITGDVYVLTLRFAGNSNPTEFEKHFNLPINGTFELFLDERRRKHRQRETSLTRLNWAVILPEGRKRGEFLFLTLQLVYETDPGVVQATTIVKPLLFVRPRR